jgi:hypothetical protein
MKQEVHDLLQNPGASGRLLFERLQVGFENPEKIEGACQVELTGEGAMSFYLVFEQDRLGFIEGKHPSPRAKVEMPAEIALDIALGDNINLLDPKNLDLIEASGDMVMVGILAQLTKLPRGDASERFKEAEARGAKLAPMATVERLLRPSVEQVTAAIAESRPIIIVGLLQELWPEAVTWTFEDVRVKFGNTTVRSNVGTMPIGEFLDQLKAPGSIVPYTYGAPLPEELLSAFPPPFYAKDTFGPAQIWMGSGPGQISTPLHRDSGEAFLGQVIGRKQFILYSPDQTEYMYAFKSFNRDQPCWANPWQPDYAKYPLFQKARATKFMLSPGELLIIPRGWYHTVRSLDVTLSIGFHREPVSDFGRIISRKDAN